MKLLLSCATFLMISTLVSCANQGGTTAPDLQQLQPTQQQVDQSKLEHALST